MFSILILSCFIGYLAVWQVTPLLHAPLMSVTNAISGIVILGALDLLAEATIPSHSFILLLAAVFFSSVNIFGGFYISGRMLKMFKPKDKKHD